jgi:hypothetical protein
MKTRMSKLFPDGVRFDGSKIHPQWEDQKMKPMNPEWFYEKSGYYPKDKKNVKEDKSNDKK